MRVFFLLLVLLQFSCTPELERRRITIVSNSPAVSLDPHTTEDTQSLAILANIYEPLVTFGKDMVLEPRLATSWSNPSETQWRFTLRKSVRFHDGRSFSARDVRYSIHRALNDPASTVRTWLKTVTEAKIIDNYTIELVTSRPSPLLLSGLSYVAIVPLDSASSLGTHANGTGPYRLKGWSRGRVDLEGSENYWKEKPNWDEAIVNHEYDPALRHRMVVEGVADLAVANESMVKSAIRSGLRVIEYPAARVAFLGFSLKGGDKNIFVKPEIRKAIALAIDYQRLIDQTLGGLAKPASQLTPFDVFGYDPTIPFQEHDPEKARQMLLPYKNELSSLSPLYCMPGGKPVAEFLRQNLATIGVQLEVRALPPEQLDVLLYRQEAPAYVLQFTFPTMDATDALIDGFHTMMPDKSMGSMNFSGYSNPQLDLLLAESNEQMIPEKRYRLLTLAMRIVLQENVWIPLCIRSNLFVSSRKIQWNGNASGRILLQEIRAAKP